MEKIGKLEYSGVKIRFFFEKIKEFRKKLQKNDNHKKRKSKKQVQFYIFLSLIKLKFKKILKKFIQSISSNKIHVNVNYVSVNLVL